MSDYSTAGATPSLWSRFTYYAGWRITGLLLAGLAVRGFLSGNLELGVVAAMFSFTYVAMIPALLVTSFRFGYTSGSSDMLTYSITGDESNLRPDLHPAQASKEIRRRTQPRP